MNKGLVQVYTGDGKGKSTAAIGQAVRCLGHGLRVAVVCFFKDPQAFGDGEYGPLGKLGVEAHFFARKHPHFYTSVSVNEVRGECLKGVRFARTVLEQNGCDVLVLEELNIALRDGYLGEEDVRGLLAARPSDVELIITGRGAPGWLVGQADLVSEVRKVKHPYDRGGAARCGFEH